MMENYWKFNWTIRWDNRPLITNHLTLQFKDKPSWKLGKRPEKRSVGQNLSNICTKNRE